MYFPLMLVVFLCFGSDSLLAGVLEQDLAEIGDGLVTFDKANQREWLDLTATSGVQLSVVQDLIQQGGEYGGFAFAKAEDVEALAISAGVMAVEPWGASGTTGREASALIQLLGEIVDGGGGVLGELSISLGQVADEIRDGAPVFTGKNFFVMRVGADLPPGSINSPLITKPVGGYFVSSPIEFPSVAMLGDDDWGPFWLYRNVVPEPNASALMLVALQQLILGRRRI